jgi:hypothetical protein
MLTTTYRATHHAKLSTVSWNRTERHGRRGGGSRVNALWRVPAQSQATQRPVKAVADKLAKARAVKDGSMSVNVSDIEKKDTRKAAAEKFRISRDQSA